jgi:hypothetical protein
VSQVFRDSGSRGGAKITLFPIFGNWFRAGVGFRPYSQEGILWRPSDSTKMFPAMRSIGSLSCLGSVTDGGVDLEGSTTLTQGLYLNFLMARGCRRSGLLLYA